METTLFDLILVNNNKLLSPDLFATQSDETMSQYPVSQSRSLHTSRSKSRLAFVNTQETFQSRGRSRPAVINTQSTSQLRAVSRPAVVNASTNVATSNFEGLY